MSENLNLTELIEQLQQIVKDGRFEYTPTNIESVKYHNTKTGGFITLEGAATPKEIEEMQDKIDDLRGGLRCAERECEDAEERLVDANNEIRRLKALLTK